MQGFLVIMEDMSTIVGRVDHRAAAVNLHSGLAHKLEAASTQPEEPVAMSDEEITVLCFALFRLANDGAENAKTAISNGKVHSSSRKQREANESRIDQTASDAYTLFKELDVIAAFKKLTRPVWDSAPQSPKA